MCQPLGDESSQGWLEAFEWGLQKIQHCSPGDMCVRYSIALAGAHACVCARASVYHIITHTRACVFVRLMMCERLWQRTEYFTTNLLLIQQRRAETRSRVRTFACVCVCPCGSYNNTHMRVYMRAYIHIVCLRKTKVQISTIHSHTHTHARIHTHTHTHILDCHMFFFF